MNGTRYVTFVIFVLLYSFVSNGQSNTIDSLTKVLQTEKEDTNTVNTLNRLSAELRKQGSLDDAMREANKAILLAKKINYKGGRDSFTYKNILFIVLRVIT